MLINLAWFGEVDGKAFEAETCLFCFFSGLGLKVKIKDWGQGKYFCMFIILVCEHAFVGTTC